jgi:hypothetical protein
MMKRGKNREMNAVGIVTVWMTKAICERYEWNARDIDERMHNE